MKKKIITSLLVATAVYYFNPDDDSIENMNCLASANSVSFKTTHFAAFFNYKPNSYSINLSFANYVLRLVY